jgi:rubrerythrin
MSAEQIKSEPVARFYTSDGTDIWKVISISPLTSVTVQNCETKDEETFILEGPAADFLPIIMPQIEVISQKSKGKNKTIPSPIPIPIPKTKPEKSGKSKYPYVRVANSAKGLKYEAQVHIKGKYKYLGRYDIEELAAAAAQEALGNKDEAARLRNLAEQSENNPDRNKDDIIWKCEDCGHEHHQTLCPAYCIRCKREHFKKIVG